MGSSFNCGLQKRKGENTMARILMRAQIQHDKAFAPETVLLENLMGGNNGNWLYQYSLFRTLMTDESVQIDTLNFQKQTINNKFISKVNEKYDCLVLPLANAFKSSFAKEMREITKLVKGLTIPCIVAGIGIQAKLGKDFSESYEDKEAAKEFVKAVLDKSSIIGVRGESTGEFLKSLGFREEKDYTVIGCPSLYLYGSKLPDVKPVDYSDSTTFLYHSKVEHETKQVVSMLNGIVEEHPNYIYAPQRLGDMIRSYFGCDYRMIDSAEKNRFYDNAKSVCFTSPYRWFDYLSKNAGFAFGTRFHGSVAAILSGVPAFIVATDQRVTELASYHNIAHIPLSEVKEDSTIRSLTENVDFNCIHRGHEQRFNHFVDFLQMNGLNNIYSKDRTVSHAYFDDIVANAAFSEDVLSFDVVSDAEKFLRTQKAAQFYSFKYAESQKKLKEQKAKAKDAEKALKACEESLQNAEETLKELQAEKLQLEAEAQNNNGFFKKFFK